ncbi:hypothetical protein SASPL_135566 [Salvia splendens]|uniref:Pentatricopeptide repeat-containing protein n=2 Tax=Salvia splendens TaxID=180675 RepID=A0A8X8ZGR4_SALSN|nr:hypothetical protein SASPL_135566 [Salvia splendens]
MLEEKAKGLYLENQLWQETARVNEVAANSLQHALAQFGGAAMAAVEEGVESCGSCCDETTESSEKRMCWITHDIRCGEPMFIGLIRHYGKVDLIDKAVEVFRDMGKSYNCASMKQSFYTILNVLVNGRLISDATELFAKGLKMGFRLNSISYNVVIKIWLGNNDWEKAMKVFDEMLGREVEHTVVTYNSQIGFLCKRGDVDVAKTLFEDMRAKGRRGNAVTYVVLMEGLCSLGRFNDAKRLMFDMEYHGCKAELVNYGVLMTELCK